MNPPRGLAGLLMLLGLMTGTGPDRLFAADEPIFVAKPYLQIGDRPKAGNLALLWHTDDVDAEWSVEYRAAVDRDWQNAATPSLKRIAVSGVAPHRVYRADLKGLVAGGEFAYRVRKSGTIVFSADGRSPKGADQPFRFVTFGDCGVNSPGQKAIAYQTFMARPDLVMITGDIVYDRGRVSE